MENKKESRTELAFRSILKWMERILAAITLAGLAGALVLQVFHMVTEPSYFADVSRMLKDLMAIVVGLEFVRMLLDTTPANIMEVLVVAITRHVILNHEEPWSNLCSIACIVGLFAARRYLVRPHELKEDISQE